MTTPTTTGTYLDKILANTAREVANRKASSPLAELERQAAERAPARSLREALLTDPLNVIAEVKRASPSKGEIAPGIVAADVAADYLAGGCAAISVLTDETFFHGTLGDLTAVADLAHADERPRPVLRKDFVIDSYQVVEARAAGADAILLIVAALEDHELRALHVQANRLGMDVLVEVHDEMELERALAVHPSIIGINNRDLRAFEVDLAVTERLAPKIPAGIAIVGESGIHERADVERLEQTGVHAVLVGESLMRRTDRAVAIRELRGRT
jgi:indole-3-glycerol phosphate synthase